MIILLYYYYSHFNEAYIIYLLIDDVEQFFSTVADHVDCESHTSGQNDSQVDNSCLQTCGESADHNVTSNQAMDF